MDADPKVAEARAKLAAKFDKVRTGGKGTARRTKVSKHQSHAADDKQLQAQLKRMGCKNCKLCKYSEAIYAFPKQRLQSR